MQILEKWKKTYQPKAEQLESPNSIGSGKPFTPENMPSGAEAAKRARLVAQLNEQERDKKEIKLKIGDLRPQPLASGAVAFTHREHGKQVFVNHPDRLELNRITEPDEVAVSLTYAIERFGSPLEIKGTKEFQQQVIEVAAERDMDITFTDEKLNTALAAKREELGMKPLQNNSISVAEIELDKSLPLDKAIDKALLDSRVKELTEINRAPIDQTDAATRSQLVMDVLERHDEVNSGFMDSAKIVEIAQQDVAAYKHLEGKPEQQKVALAMYGLMQSKDLGAAYSTAIKENGPSELMLTIDASRIIQSKPELSIVPDQKPESQELDASVKRFVESLDRAKQGYIIDQPAQINAGQEPIKYLVDHGPNPGNEPMSDSNSFYLKTRDTTGKEEILSLSEGDINDAIKGHETAGTVRMDRDLKVDTADHILDRSHLYANTVIEAKQNELADVKVIDDRLRIINSNDVQTLPQDVSKEWAAIDAMEYKKITDPFEKEKAAVAMLINAGGDKSYALHLQQHEPALVEETTAIVAKNDIAVEEKDAAKLRGISEGLKAHGAEQDKAVAQKDAAEAPLVEQPNAIQRIIDQAAVIEMNMRHEKLQSKSISGGEVAETDLKAFTKIQSQTEKNTMAIAIDKMMLADSDYKEHVALKAPDDLYVTIGAAHAMQDSVAAQHNAQNDKDIQM